MNTIYARIVDISPDGLNSANILEFSIGGVIYDDSGTIVGGGGGFPDIDISSFPDADTLRSTLATWIQDNLNGGDPLTVIWL